tara:strand:+ start:950 stop:1114 length:165 start_codon:yes stop_codon:yes gene_type:complete
LKNFKNLGLGHFMGFEKYMKDRLKNLFFAQFAFLNKIPNLPQIATFLIFLNPSM